MDGRQNGWHIIINAGIYMMMVPYRTESPSLAMKSMHVRAKSLAVHFSCFFELLQQNVAELQQK